jgi:hypothetical protein
MSLRQLAGEIRARVTVWWYVRQQLRGNPGWPGTQKGLPGTVEKAIAGLWEVFDEAPERLTAAQSSLMHAWVADGLIANGGMLALVDSLGERGPTVVQGFRDLGVPAYADAVALALELFPTAGAPEPADRLAVADAWASGGPEEAELGRLEEISFSFADVLPIKAAAFVADHPGDFAA